MKVISLAVITVVAVFIAAVYSVKPAMAASESSQAKIEWHIVGTKLLFNKKETEKLSVSSGAVAAMGALFPPPFDLIIVSVSATVSLYAATAAIDGKCVGVRINPPLPFMPVAVPFVYKPSKEGSGRYCK